MSDVPTPEEIGPEEHARLNAKQTAKGIWQIDCTFSVDTFENPVNTEYVARRTRELIERFEAELAASGKTVAHE